LALAAGTLRQDRVRYAGCVCTHALSIRRAAPRRCSACLAALLPSLPSTLIHSHAHARRAYHASGMGTRRSTPPCAHYFSAAAAAVPATALLSNAVCCAGDDNNLTSSIHLARRSRRMQLSMTPALRERANELQQLPAALAFLSLTCCHPCASATIGVTARHHYSGATAPRHNALRQLLHWRARRRRIACSHGSARACAQRLFAPLSAVDLLFLLKKISAPHTCTCCCPSLHARASHIQTLLPFLTSPASRQGVVAHLKRMYGVALLLLSQIAHADLSLNDRRRNSGVAASRRGVARVGAVLARAWLIAAAGSSRVPGSLWACRRDGALCSNAGLSCRASSRAGVGR